MSQSAERSRRFVAVVAAALLALFCATALSAVAAPTAWAQEDSGESNPGEERAETFEADTSGAQTENIPGGLLMVAAYAVVWTVLLGYLMSLGVRQAKTARNLERLRQDLEAREPASAED